MAVDEETRAAEFRRAATARAQWECDQRLSAFSSNAGSVVAFRDRWEPVTNKDRGWDAPECSDDGLQVP